MGMRSAYPGLKKIPAAGGTRWCWAASQLSRRSSGFEPRTQLLWVGLGEPDSETLAGIARRCAELTEALARWGGDGRPGRPVCIQGSIYFARCGEAVKIGFSARPAHRLRDLQIGSAEPVELIGWMPGSPAVERLLHHRFASLRIRGEWFSAAPSLLRFVERVTPGHDPVRGRFRMPAEPVDGPENFR